MTHNRKLVLGGVSLTMARIPAKLNGAAANRVRDEIEREMILSGFLDGAPFKWVGLVIRYGLVDDIKPHYERISKKYGDLPLAIEIDVHRLLNATEDEMTAVYRKAALIALAHVGVKYRLNATRINQLLEEIL